MKLIHLPLIPILFAAPLHSEPALITTPQVTEVYANKVQAPARIYSSVYNQVNAGNIRLEIRLGEQRAYLYAGDQVAIDTPVSTGKAGHSTPVGSYPILQKKEIYRSNLYGSYVNKKGHIVKAGATSRRKAPPGCRFLGTPIPFWQRLTEHGIGMHAGTLPGYAASYGCIRFPSEVIPLIYAKTSIGTIVKILQ